MCLEWLKQVMAIWMICNDIRMKCEDVMTRLDMFYLYGDRYDMFDRYDRDRECLIVLSY